MEQLRAGMSHPQISAFASEFIVAPPNLKGQKEKDFNDFQQEVSDKLASDLLDQNQRLDQSISTRLEAVVRENGRLTGWGKPDKKDYKGKQPQFESDSHAYKIAEEVAIRAVVIGTMSLGKKEFKDILKRSIAEGKQEKKSPIVEKTGKHKVEYANFVAAVQKTADKFGDKGKRTAAFIDAIVFPKGAENAPLNPRMKLREVKSGFRSARHSAENDTETAKIYDAIEYALTGEKPSKKSGPARTKEIAVDRAKFLAEPVTTPLPLKVFREKIAYVISQSGFIAKTPAEVMQKMGTNINHVGEGKNGDIFTRAQMLRVICGQIYKTRFLTHESGRALLAAIDTLFTPDDFRRYSNALQGATLKSVQENFMRNMLPKIMEAQTAYTDLAKNKSGYVVMTATNQSLMYLSESNPDASVSVKPNTMVLVDAKDMKSEGNLVKVWVDGLPYYMTKFSLTEIAPEVKSVRRKAEKNQNKADKPNSKPSALEKKLSKSGLKVTKLKEKPKTTKKK